MRKLYLHIGPHKTGSTFLQQCFFDNRHVLAEVGITYPTVDIRVQYGHHKLVEQIKTLSQQELECYLRTYLQADIVLLSSENFDRLTATDIQKLASALAALDRADVRIIYYHRNYVDLFQSTWQEDIKHGSVKSFSEFLMPHILFPFRSKLVNPEVVLDLYSNAFGKEHITIVDYDSAMAAEGILSPMLEILDVSGSCDFENKLINRSLPVERAELIRALNILAYLDNRLRLHNVREAFLRNQEMDAIQDDLVTVETAIRDATNPQVVSKGYFSASITTGFRRNYISCVHNELSDDRVTRVLKIPSDKWVYRDNVYAACRRIYHQVMSDVVC